LADVADLPDPSAEPGRVVEFKLTTLCSEIDRADFDCGDGRVPRLLMDIRVRLLRAEVRDLA
jgi:hypothetical protein